MRTGWLTVTLSTDRSVRRMKSCARITDATDGTVVHNYRYLLHKCVQAKKQHNAPHQQPGGAVVDDAAVDDKDVDLTNA